MSNFTKRIYISICGGLAIPFGYLLVLIMLDAIFRLRPARAWRWLLFPLISFGVAYRSVIHPAVDDVWGVPLDSHSIYIRFECRFLWLYLFSGPVCPR